MSKKKGKLRTRAVPDMTPEACRRIREALGLTQEQFGEKIGVRPLAVSLWETGKTPISKGRALAIRALAITGSVTEPTAEAVATA